jgi:hypothetical protein
MPSSTCPSINTNFLSPNGFLLQIERLPLVSYFTQSISLPSLSLPPQNQSTPFSDIGLPGDKLEFEDLVVPFKVDSDMANYLEAFKWIQGLGFPENNTQYTTENQPRSQSFAIQSELSRNYSEAKLIILGSNNQPLKTFNFIDCFPIALTGIEFSSTNTDVDYASSSLTLRYSYFNVDE